MRRFLIPPGVINDDNKSNPSGATEPSRPRSSPPPHAVAEDPPVDAVVKRARLTAGPAERVIVAAPSWKHDDHVSLLSADQQREARSVSQGRWVGVNGVLMRLHTHCVSSTPVKGVVCFDMDGTLIKTKSGARFPQGADDWKMWDASVTIRMRELHDQGYLLAILSNQAGVGGKKQDAQELKTKVENILAELAVPVDFICSTESASVFRKPCTGMWDFLSAARWEPLLSEQGLSMQCVERVYVGDAAGRVKEGARAKDHSDVDLKLAINLGVAFATPELFFLQSTHRLHTLFSGDITGSVRLASLTRTPPSELTANPHGAEIVLLVAPAAAGKSTVARALESSAGYARVNQDELKTLPACLNKAREELRVGRSVCVDNTNLNVEVRRNWINLAKELGVSIRCIVLNTPKDVCMTLATLRLIDARTSERDRRKIETVVLHKHFKDLSTSPPKLQEGFSSIEERSFTLQLPDKSTHPTSHRLYHMYLK